uniref:PE/PPE C-terminal domain-containing protein n=1 Tax=Mycobacterium sp. HUMS_1102779 TaxID=3383487 RepID=UPI003899D087
VPNSLKSIAQGGTSFNPITYLENVLGSTAFQHLNALAGDSGSTALVFASSAYLTGGVLAQTFPLMSLALPAAAAAADASAVSPGLGGGVGATLLGSPGSAAGALGPAGLGRAGVSAGMGESTLVGGLSVPPAWGTAAPAVRLAAMGFPMGSPTTGLDAAPAAAASPGFFGGIPPMASVVNAPRGTDTYSQGLRTKLFEQDAGKTGNTRSRPPQPQRGAPNAEIAAREGEPDLVTQLRREIAEAALERDAAARLIMEAIR